MILNKPQSGYVLKSGWRFKMGLANIRLEKFDIFLKTAFRVLDVFGILNQFTGLS